MSKESRLPRSDIPPDFKCPYPACGFSPKPDSKRPELAFRSHMGVNHNVHYETAMPSAVAMKLAKLGGARYDTDLATLEDLKPWHCTALARHVVYGQAFSEVAKEMPGKHSPESIRAVAKSPAGQAFMEKMTQELRDPVKLVKDLAKSDSFEMYVMWLQARDWAYQAKDYEAIHKMAKDIGLQPMLEDQAKSGPTKISLHLNMSDLASTPVKTSYSYMEAEVVEEPDEQEE